MAKNIIRRVNRGYLGGQTYELSLDKDGYASAQWITPFQNNIRDIEWELCKKFNLEDSRFTWELLGFKLKTQLPNNLFKGDKYEDSWVIEDAVMEEYYKMDEKLSFYKYIP